MQSRPGVTIGDGCVIGASSVVTRSVPAYHVAVGSPARPIRKTSLDAPHAPGLHYEQVRGRSLVLAERSVQKYVGEDQSGFAIADVDPAAESEKRSREVLHHVKPVYIRHITVDVVVLVLAVVVVSMIVHGILY